MNSYIVNNKYKYFNLFIGNILLGLSQVDESKIKILQSDCLPHIIHRITDPYMGEIMIQILLQISLSPHFPLYVNEDNIIQLMKSIQDPDVSWQNLIWRVMINTFVYSSALSLSEKIMRNMFNSLLATCNKREIDISLLQSYEYSKDIELSGNLHRDTNNIVLSLDALPKKSRRDILFHDTTDIGGTHLSVIVYDLISNNMT
jgi:hypothetical protein